MKDELLQPRSSFRATGMKVIDHYSPCRSVIRVLGQHFCVSQQKVVSQWQLPSFLIWQQIELVKDVGEMRSEPGIQIMGRKQCLAVNTISLTSRRLTS